MSAAASESAVEAGAATPLGNPPAFEGGVQPVGAGAFAWIQPNGELGESNAGLVVGDGASLLIDTLWDERLTRRMLDALVPARAGAPITTLFNTHGDGDHWYGNGLVGGARIVATDAAERQMRAEPPAMLTRLGPLSTVSDALISVPLLPGKSRLRGIAAFSEQLSRYEFAGIDPRLPDECFSGELTLEVGGRRVELYEVGPAHTPGDAIAWVPDARVVFSGDVVFNGVTPIMWAGPASNWINSLERIAGLDPLAIVPGHGPVCERNCLEDLIGYWSYLIRSVPAGAGDAVVELAEALVRGVEYRTSPWGEWLGPERTLVNVAMIARERDGETGPVSTAKRIALLSQMGALRERLESSTAQL